MQEIPMKSSDREVTADYERAREVYAAWGVDVDTVLRQLAGIQISLQCWQGDDVTGFETGVNGLSDGGIMATGNYRGRARNGAELRRDMEEALRLIPGKQRVNLHAIYAETGGKPVGRDELTAEHFGDWMDWAKNLGIGLDFNPTFFSHPLASSGFTLASRDEGVRSFWVRHGKCCREIAAQFGKELGTPAVNNLWIPDGSKDFPADRLLRRQLLKESLDEIFARQYDPRCLVDAVESKLFGIGSESFVVGSHEFYLDYISGKRIAICLDMGHFHPTENLADKISALLVYPNDILLHISRGVRWDSDHVAILSDDLIAVTQEIKRAAAFNRVYLALDFFDASINRMTAWICGARAALKAILIALLEPTARLQEAECQGNLGERLALLEEFKALPWSAVWDRYCLDQNVPTGAAWLEPIREYEERVLVTR